MKRFEFLTGLVTLFVMALPQRRSNLDAPIANSLDILVGWLKQATRVDIWLGDPTGNGQVIFYEKDAIKRALDELERLRKKGDKQCGK